jgi:hypothetical protein
VTPRPAPRVAAPATLTLNDYDATVYGAGPQATFLASTIREQETIARLVPALLEAAWSTEKLNPAWHEDANRAGFRIEDWTVLGERYWALLEASGNARGAGAYVFRVGPRADGATILLEAPHNYHDVGTGRLAADVFFAKRDGARPRALFTNTIHRYQLAPGDKKKRKVNPADVAHNADHVYTFATSAFAAMAGDTHVIQLHGFGARDADEDGDGDPSGIAMVVSAGDAKGSSPLSTAIAAAATQAFGDGVKRFPEDTKELGATTNVQGRALRKTGRGEFVHIEMSADLRKRLAASQDLRKQLAAVLFDTEVPK